MKTSYLTIHYLYYKIYLETCWWFVRHWINHKICFYYACVFKWIHPKWNDLFINPGNVPTNNNAASKSLADQINRQDTTTTTADHAKKIATKVVNSLGQYVPSSNLGVIIAITSLCFTLLITCCVACSRCRKRGKGKKYLYPTGIKMFMLLG